MYLGAAHSAGKYDVGPAGDQFTNGCNDIYARGFQVLKVYCTADYLTDYPLQADWDTAPTTLTELAQTALFTTQLSRDWAAVQMTIFTFANGSTNWWRVSPSASKLAAEYTEIYNLAVHLLSTYSGKTFILQNWEGDWAFMDIAGAPDTRVDRELVDRYVAFLGVRQRAVEDARRATASSSRVLMAVEANRVLDAREYHHRRRICRDIAKRIRPDVVSWSAYDGTIDTPVGFGADYATWAAYTLPRMRKAMAILRHSFPYAQFFQIGEYGFPEVQAVGLGRDVGDMVGPVIDEATAAGFSWCTYWQIFDNEELSPGNPRGFYLTKPDGSDSDAAAKYATLL